jgi:ankyrin repeat protein
MEALPERSVASSQTSFLESDEDQSEIMPVSKSHASRRKDIDELPGLDFEAGGRIEGINEQDVGRKVALALDNRQSVSSWLENLSYNHNSTDSQKRKTWPLSDHANRWKVLLAVITFVVRSQRVNRMNILEAASQGSHKQVHALLLRDVDIHFTDGSSETALFHAARNGHITTVELLLSNGADVNWINGRRETALSHAARNGHTTIVELLLSYGASWSLAQTPPVSGDDTVAFPDHYEPVTETVQDNMVSLSVGKIHGIHAGTQFISAVEPSITVEIAEVDDCKSRAKVIGGRFIDDPSKPLWFLPYRWSKAESLEVTVSPDLGRDFYRHLVSELNKRLVGQFSCLEGPQAADQEDTERFLIHLEKDATSIDIRGQRWLFGNEGHIRDWKVEGQTDKEQAYNSAIALRHLFRFGQILRLQSKPEGTAQFKINITQEREYPPTFRFHYENTGEEELYFSVIALSSGFNVKQLYPGREVPLSTAAGARGSFTFRMVPPMPPGGSGTSEASEHRGLNNLKNTLLKRTGKIEHREFLKTIVVRGRGISLKSVQMPDIWNADEWGRQAIESSRNGEVVQDLHWWVHDETFVWGV